MDRERREKRDEASRKFDAVLRARVARGGLTPRVASFLEPPEPEPHSNETGEGEHES